MASSESDDVKVWGEKCAESDEGGKGPRDTLSLVELGMGIGMETEFTVDVAQRVCLASSMAETQFCTS